MASILFAMARVYVKYDRAQLWCMCSYGVSTVEHIAVLLRF